MPLCWSECFISLFVSYACGYVLVINGYFSFMWCAVVYYFIEKLYHSLCCSFENEFTNLCELLFGVEKMFENAFKENRVIQYQEFIQGFVNLADSDQEFYIIFYI